MKKYFLVFLILTLSLPLLSQRLRVKTFQGTPSDYREHYTYILDAATNNGTATVYIAGNPTDKPAVNAKITAHKIVGQDLLSSKDGLTNSVPSDKFLLTDFTVQPSTDIRYGAGTGVYYPNGPTGNGYPFLGLYNKSTLQIQSFSTSTFPTPAMNLPIPQACGSNTPERKKRITYAG